MRVRCVARRFFLPFFFAPRRASYRSLPAHDAAECASLSEKARQERAKKDRDAAVVGGDEGGGGGGEGGGGGVVEEVKVRRRRRRLAASVAADSVKEGKGKGDDEKEKDEKEKEKDEGEGENDDEEALALGASLGRRVLAALNLTARHHRHRRRRLLAAGSASSPSSSGRRWSMEGGSSSGALHDCGPNVLEVAACEVKGFLRHACGQATKPALPHLPLRCCYCCCLLLLLVASQVGRLEQLLLNRKCLPKGPENLRFEKVGCKHGQRAMQR